MKEDKENKSIFKIYQSHHGNSQNFIAENTIENQQRFEHTQTNFDRKSSVRIGFPNQLRLEDKGIQEISNEEKKLDKDQEKKNKKIHHIQYFDKTKAKKPNKNKSKPAKTVGKKVNKFLKTEQEFEKFKLSQPFMGRSIEIIKDVENTPDLRDTKLIFQINKNRRKSVEGMNRNKILYFNNNERPYFNENVDRNAEKYTQTKAFIPLQIPNCKCIECLEKGSKTNPSKVQYFSISKFNQSKRSSSILSSNNERIKSHKIRNNRINRIKQYDENVRNKNLYNLNNNSKNLDFNFSHNNSNFINCIQCNSGNRKIFSNNEKMQVSEHKIEQNDQFNNSTAKKKPVVIYNEKKFNNQNYSNTRTERMIEEENSEVNKNQDGILAKEDKNMYANLMNLQTEHELESNVIKKNSRLADPPFYLNNNKMKEDEAKELKFKMNKEIPIQSNEGNSIINLNDINNITMQKYIKQERKQDVFIKPSKLNKILQDEMNELFQESTNYTHLNRFLPSDSYDDFNEEEKKQVINTNNIIHPDKDGNLAVKSGNNYIFQSQKENGKNQNKEYTNLNFDIKNELPIEHLQKENEKNYSKNKYLDDLNFSNNNINQFENKSKLFTSSRFQQNEMSKKGKIKSEKNDEYKQIVNEFSNLTSKK